MILETDKIDLIVPCFLRSKSDKNRLERLIDLRFFRKNGFLSHLLLMIKVCLYQIIDQMRFSILE